jgi:NADPH-dependent curcumin reductase CurA
VCLRSDGAVDTTFGAQAGGAFDGVVTALATRSGRVVAAGTFSEYAGAASNRLVRIEG